MGGSERQRLGALLRDGRKQLGLTQGAIATSIGVTRNTLRRVERGEIKRVTPTITAYARRVGWTDGAIEDVLAGGEPSLRPGVGGGGREPTEVLGEGPAFAGSGQGSVAQSGEGAAAEMARILAERLPLRVLQELTDGELLDSDILDLTEDGSAAVMTLVVARGPVAASPDQIRQDLQEWSATQRKIRRVVQRRQDAQD